MIDLFVVLLVVLVQYTWVYIRITASFVGIISTFVLDLI
jgi:hypothetical protein